VLLFVLSRFMTPFQVSSIATVKDRDYLTVMLSPGS
jgi:hypothetical protein